MGGVSGIGKIEILPPMSMNLRFLNVGSAAALVMTVTDIPLSRHGEPGSRSPDGWAGVARDWNLAGKLSPPIDPPNFTPKFVRFSGFTRVKYLEIREPKHGPFLILDHHHESLQLTVERERE